MYESYWVLRKQWLISEILFKNSYLSHRIIDRSPRILKWKYIFKRLKPVLSLADK